MTVFTTLYYARHVPLLWALKINIFAYVHNLWAWYGSNAAKLGRMYHCNSRHVIFSTSFRYVWCWKMKRWKMDSQENFSFEMCSRKILQRNDRRQSKVFSLSKDFPHKAFSLRHLKSSQFLSQSSTSSVIESEMTKLK